MMGPPMDESPSGLWHRPELTKPKAVVVLAHGLNLKPEKMDDWAKALRDRGALVLRVGLYGHRGLVQHMKEASAKNWREEFEEEVKKAQEVARENKVPLYFLGFSLGAVVGLDWQTERLHDQGFEKMVLIAPALALPWYSKQAIRFFSMFGRSFMLPSRSPADYRANRGTSVAAYEALFEIKADVEKARYKNTNIDTLVLIDKHDELVVSDGIRKIIAQYELSRWQLELLDNNFAYRTYGFRHLMVDRDAVGDKLWSHLVNRMAEHFGLDDQTN